MESSETLAELANAGAVAAMPLERLLAWVPARWLVILPDTTADLWRVGTMADDGSGWKLDPTVGIHSGLTWRRAKRIFAAHVHTATRF